MPTDAVDLRHRPYFGAYHPPVGVCYPTYAYDPFTSSAFPVCLPVVPSPPLYDQRAGSSVVLCAPTNDETRVLSVEACDLAHEHPAIFDGCASDPRNTDIEVEQCVRDFTLFR